MNFSHLVILNYHEIGYCNQKEYTSIIYTKTYLFNKNLSIYIVVLYISDLKPTSNKFIFISMKQ